MALVCRCCFQKVHDSMICKLYPIVIVIVVLLLIAVQVVRDGITNHFWLVVWNIFYFPIYWE